MPSTDLERFIVAQDRDSTYRRALGELAAGRKRTHWMWFVFPQLTGLGSSPAAVHFGLDGIQEARAYAAHPVLGVRLRECVRQLAAHPQSSASQLLGDVDALKLRSSLTLFCEAAPDEPLFADELARRFDGPDPRTLRMLGRG
ncbi:MAG: hypothetical protein JWO02_927 [Solirubrobacterales bacterium]|nr:hypothetical protein [Solirubrobacterales bacterium]